MNNIHNLRNQPTQSPTNPSNPSTHSAPSLSSSAMLVELCISTWEGRKKDKGASDSVALDNGAQKKMLNTTKKLLDCEQLTAIKSMANAMRMYHRDATLPWSQSGPRLLTNLQFMDYHPEITGMIQEFYNLVDQFMNVYTWEVADAQAKLGNLFDINEYPDPATLRRRFRAQLGYSMLPAKGDFRIDIAGEGQEVLAKIMADHYDEQMTRAMTDLWHRLIKPVKNMSGMLDYGPKDKPSGFRDTLVSNVEDMLGMLKTCNIANDPEMERVRRELSAAMRGVTPEGLRMDAYLRSDTKRKIDTVLLTLPQLPSLDM